MESNSISDWLRSVLPDTNSDLLRELTAKLHKDGFKSLQDFRDLVEKDITDLDLLTKVETRRLMREVKRQFGAIDVQDRLQLEIQEQHERMQLERRKVELEAEHQAKALEFKIRDAQERNDIKRAMIELKKQEKEAELKMTEMKCKSQQDIEKMKADTQKSLEESKAKIELMKVELEHRATMRADETKRLELAVAAHEAMVSHKKSEAKRGSYLMFASAVGAVAFALAAPVSLPALAVGATACFLAEGTSANVYFKNSDSSYPSITGNGLHLK